MDQIVLRTYVDEDDADVMYEYEIVKCEREDGDTEYVVYRIVSMLNIQTCGKYDYLLDAVKGLHAHMANEICEVDE